MRKRDIDVLAAIPAFLQLISITYQTMKLLAKMQERALYPSTALA